MKVRALLGLSVAGLVVVLVSSSAGGASGPNGVGRSLGAARPSQSAITGTPSLQALATPLLESDAPRLASRGERKQGKNAPAPEQPPSVEPTPTPPPAPPVVPEEPAIPPAAPGVVTGVVCTSGDMVDRIGFSAPADGGLVEAYRLLSASTATGTYSIVDSVAAGACGFTVSVDATATAYYRVVAVGPGGEGQPSGTVDNGHVSISAEVPASGATLRSSNGEMALVFPAGSVASTSSVTIEEIDGTPAGGIISLAGVYDISSAAPLQSPVTLSVAYTIKVTHFQVSAAMLSHAQLMTYDATEGKWVQGASNVRVEDGMLAGELPHFSYWSGGVIQPHGTSTTDYCSDGAICHNLSAYPGTLTRLSGKDPQVCFNCHGSFDLTAGPAGASGENVQASMQGAGSVSSHPVAIGDLACTSCHDPHANPSTSPGLLRAADAVTGKYVEATGGVAPATTFCWACHGTVVNRRIDYLVPTYWTASGGDKKTGFNGAHTAVGTAGWRWDTMEELQRGFAGSADVTADGLVTIAGSLELPKTPVPPISVSPVPGAYYTSPTPAVAYNGSKTDLTFQWYAKDMGAAGATELNPLTGSANMTIDLGAPTSVSAFDLYSYVEPSSGQGAFAPDVLEILTSDDNATWRTIGSQGTIGSRLAETVTINASDTCRYVRFVFTRRFVNDFNSIIPSEVTIHAPATQGTFEVWPNIARKAAFSSGVVRWTSSEPASTSVSVSVRASVNNGTTWTSWQPVVNGGAITQIAAGASLESARLQVRATLNGSGVSPSLDSLDVSITRGAIVGATPQWSGESPANLCLRCHTSHGSVNSGLVATGSSAACSTCHSAAYGGSYAGTAQFAGSVHAAVPCANCHTAHGKSNNSGVTYAFLLKDDRTDACLGCHTAVQGAFDAKTGVASEWAKHDVYSAEQVKSTSNLACKNCHGTHASASGLVNPDSIATAYTTMRDDPTSIPTGEVVIEASRDTLLDSTTGQQSWNYGASTQVTITPSTRALLYFDLSAIPAGATIQNAELVLWGTTDGSANYKGGYLVYPMSRDWLEGTGTGTANSAGVNGASWLEWKYGDNANTGDTAGGDWQALGGDRGAAGTYDTGGLIARNVTSLVTSLRQGPNYGIMVGPYDATTSIAIYTRHNVTAQYRPRLRIVYQTGPATRQILDDVTFCTKCHDGSMPLGLSGQTLSSVGNAYASGAHGAKKGLGPESEAFGYWGADRGGGGLKAPYSYGMDALPCTTCHDPHGSRLPYHLKEVINGQSIVPPYGYAWDYELAPKAAGLGYVCAACHIFPSNHTAYETMMSGCIGCHVHAGR